MVGTDWGFDSAAGLGIVAEEVVRRNIGAMVDGAVATKQLFR
jgi:hypothetical protein